MCKRCYSRECFKHCGCVFCAAWRYIFFLLLHTQSPLHQLLPVVDILFLWGSLAHCLFVMCILRVHNLASGLFLKFGGETHLHTWGSSVNSLSGRVFGHTYFLANIQWLGLFNHWTLLLTENCLQWEKWSPYEGREAFSIPICAEMERNGPPKPFYSQPRQSTSCVYACLLR